MKIKRFVIFIKKMLLKRINTDVKTIQLILQELYCDLSESELKREGNNILALKKITSQQITLDEIVRKEKTRHLDEKLIELKNDE